MSAIRFVWAWLPIVLLVPIWMVLWLVEAAGELADQAGWWLMHRVIHPLHDRKRRILSRGGES